jgi:hypothetical protein
LRAFKSFSHAALHGSPFSFFVWLRTGDAKTSKMATAINEANIEYFMVSP